MEGVCRVAGEHAERNHGDAVWAGPLLQILCSVELAIRRALFNNRPRTRCFSGFSPKRWQDGFDFSRRRQLDALSTT